MASKQKHTHVLFDGRNDPDFGTLEELAVMKLQHDGHRFEIRKAEDGHGYELWGSVMSSNAYGGNQPLVKTGIYSLMYDYGVAREDIYRKVAAAKWRGYPDIYTIEEWESADECA